MFGSASNETDLRLTTRSWPIRKISKAGWRVGSASTLDRFRVAGTGVRGQLHPTDSRRYSASLGEQARDAARLVMRFPLRRRIVPEVHNESVREVFVKSYRLIYEIRSDRIVILAFIHGARRFPSNLLR